MVATYNFGSVYMLCLSLVFCYMYMFLLLKFGHSYLEEIKYLAIYPSVRPYFRPSFRNAISS